MINYPDKIDNTISLPTVVDNLTAVRAITVNRLRDAILAIEAELGTNPAGISGNVRSRIMSIESAITSGSNTIFGGDVNGTLISQTVIGIQNKPISNTPPKDGYVLTWNNIDGYWSPKASSGLIDPLRPFVTDILITEDSSPHIIPGLTLEIPDNTATEISATIVANSSAESAIFYMHASYKRSGGAPIAMSFTINPNNAAFTAGAVSWLANLVINANNITVVVQEPDGTSVKWTGEIKLTIGEI